MIAPVGKSGPGIELEQSLEVEPRVVDQRKAGVDHLAQVVRRDVGRHADRDAAGAVDQQVRELGRQDARLPVGLVVVRPEVDRVLVDVVRAGHQRPGQGAPRCSASPPADRRPSSRSCPGRRSAPGAWRSPGPCAPTRRRWRPGHADGTCPSRRRRCVRSCAAAGHIRSRPRASRRGSGDAPASGRRARRAALAPRSRSWRNRGRSAASPPRSGRSLRGGAGWKPKLNCPAGERTLKHRPVARRASSV